MTPFELVLSRLPHAKRNGKNWAARCPAHEDTRPSLSITEGDDGGALVFCHAGCPVEAITAALGLKLMDLMPANTPTAPAPTRKPATKTKPTATAARVFAKAADAVAELECQHGKRSALWTYHNADGQPVGVIVRWNLPNGDKDIRPVAKTPDGWCIGGMPEPRPLYHLPKLLARPGERVHVCEGEKCCDAMAGLGLLATTSPHGSQSAGKADWVRLAGRDVVILPDADEAGERYAADVAKILAKLTPPARVKVLRLPGLVPGSGEDICEWLERDGRDCREPEVSRAEIEALADAAPTIEPVTNDAGHCEDDHPAESQSTLLVKLAEGAELFHTPGMDGDGYATIPVADHRETWRVSCKGFRRWLCGRFWKTFSKAPNSQALQDSLAVISSKALYEGPARVVAVRVAQHGDATYLDLANDRWQAVEITRDGWRVVDDPPVRFIRPAGLLPLPTPVGGGSVDELRQFVSIGDDADWALILAWLVQALRGRGPFPILVVSGEQGSAKSTTCRLLRALIDPNIAPLRCESKEVRDLMIAANNSSLLAFDNLSHVQNWLSDALCRLSTGGGFATRELYSDGEERLFDAMRPVMLNGVEALGTRSDLLDRCITVELPMIPEQKRKCEADLWRDFEPVRPRTLGALLDAVVEGIRNLETVKLDRLPRMADFARFAVASERALGLGAGAFMRAYADNREAANALALETAVIGPAVVELMETRDRWEGTPQDLLAALSAEPYTDGATRNRQDWPKTPRGLSAALRRLAPNLRRLRIETTFVRKPGGNRSRMIFLERVGDIPSRPSHTVPPSIPEAENAVGRDEAGTVGDGSGRYDLANRPAKTAGPVDRWDGRDGRNPACSGGGGGGSDGESGAKTSPEATGQANVTASRGIDVKSESTGGPNREHSHAPDAGGWGQL